MGMLIAILYTAWKEFIDYRNEIVNYLLQSRPFFVNYNNQHNLQILKKLSMDYFRAV